MRVSPSVKAMQWALRASGANVAVDGKYGPKTYKAYQGMNADVRSAIEGLMAVLPQDYATAQSSNANADRSLVYDLRVIADVYDLNPDEFVAFARIESDLDPLAVNGEFRGLFQISEEVWNDMSPLVRSKTGRVVKGYMQGGWQDPMDNAYIAAQYMLENEKSSRAYGYRGPWDATAMYMAHQQGAKGFAEIWMAAQTGSVLTGSRLRNVLNNPPQDNLGATSNPREFVARWSDVIAAKAMA